MRPFSVGGAEGEAAEDRPIVLAFDGDVADAFFGQGEIGDPTEIGDGNDAAAAGFGNRCAISNR